MNEDVLIAVNDFCKKNNLKVSHFGKGPCNSDDSSSDFIIKV
jgi:hypothetical protein